MNSNELNKKTYNKIAKDWHDEHVADTWWGKGMEKFMNLFSSGDSILDVGCAGGQKAKLFTDKGLKVLGVDFAEKFIELAKKTAPRAQFRVLDLYDIKELEQVFDGVFIQAVLLHVPKEKAQNVIKECTDRLNPGGYFYIAVKEMGADQPDEEIKEEDDYGYLYKRLFVYYTLEEIKEYFKNVGLRVIYENIHLAGHSRWIQVIAQKI